MSSQLYLVMFILVFAIVSIVSFKMTFEIKKKEFRKKIKLDVTKEQMLKSEEMIKEFLTQNNIEPNNCIPEIAKILKVEDEGIETELEEQACLKPYGTDGKKVVIFKKGLSKQEKTFAYVHEIAHLLNGDTIPATRPSGYNKSEIEQLADYTAAALLMPLEEVYDYLEISNYKKCSAKKRTVIIHDLCKAYNVTEIIALRRVKEVYVLKASE